MRRLSYSVFFCVSAVWASAACAHHSFASVYDTHRNVVINGVVTEFAFINPHPYLVVEVARNDGKKDPWRAEMDNRLELAEIGIGAETFKPGDRVMVNGSRDAVSRRFSSCGNSSDRRMACVTSRSALVRGAGFTDVKALA